MDVVRRQRRRPAQPGGVESLLGDGGDGAGHPDAVGTHRDADRLAVGALRVEAERVRELASELEDVADLDAAGDGELAAATRTTVAVADLDRAELLRRLEVASTDDERGVLVLLVRTGDPRTARDDQRVDDVTDADLGEQLRPDVAPDEARVFRQVVSVGLRHLDGFELSGDPLEV